MHFVFRRRYKIILSFVILIFQVILLPVLFAEDSVDEKNILNEEWVENYRKKKDKEINWKEEEKRDKELTALLGKGIGFYKKKDDKNAIEEYKKAILLYPTSATFYHFANSLTNIGRLPDSVKAYKIALKYDDSNKALIYYNLACAYSRLSQLDESKSNLHLAIEFGYTAIQQIKKDPDLENLRKIPGWDKGLIDLLKAHNINKSKLIGEVYEQGPRSGDSFYLCSNGYFVQKSEYHCDQKYKSFSRGKWELISNEVELDIKEYCYLTYETTAKQRKKYDGSEVPTQCYGTPKFAECTLPTRKYKKFFDYDHIEEVINTKPEKKKDDFQTYRFKRFQSGEPKECDPNFYPKDLEDYKVQ